MSNKKHHPILLNILIEIENIFLDIKNLKMNFLTIKEYSKNLKDPYKYLYKNILNNLLYIILKYYVNNNIFKYRGKCRRIHKQNKNYIGLVNDHHVIPKSLKNHNLFQIKSILVFFKYHQTILQYDMV